jgi:arthrofactin-type cyclic lipopeptide synthetase C
MSEMVYYRLKALRMGTPTVTLQATTESIASAVLIRSGNSEPPLFLTHCAAGQLLYADRLARQFDLQIPVYGLPPVPPGGSILRTVEGMATRMVRLIRRIQPLGPYRIAGWSFGGILAYEIAMQLLGADLTVDFVGLIDTPYPGVHDEPLNQDATPGLKHHAASPPPETASPQANSAQDGWLSHHPNIYFQAAHDYFLRPLPASVHFFGTDDCSQDYQAWTGALGEDHIKLVPVPGTYDTIISSPIITILGPLVANAIQNIRSPLERTSEQRRSPVIPLTTRSTGTRLLLCVPGAGANVACFRELTASLDSTWLIYGFQPRGLDAQLIPHATIESCAELCVKKLEHLYPIYPTHILGHSLGGWIALETAHRLTEAGCAVSSLTLIDTDIPDENQTTIREYTYTEIVLAWIRLAETHFGKPLDITMQDLQSLMHDDQRRLLHARLVSIGAISRHSDPDILKGSLTTFAAGVRIHYTPEATYPGRARLVVAEQALPGLDDNRPETTTRIDKWRKWIPGLIPMKSPASHPTLLRSPHVQVIARALEDDPAAEQYTL